jgi:hypothetical protein
LTYFLPTDIPATFTASPKGFAHRVRRCHGAGGSDETGFVVKGRELEVVFAQERARLLNEMRGQAVNHQNRDRKKVEEMTGPQRGRGSGGGGDRGREGGGGDRDAVAVGRGVSGGNFQRSSPFERVKAHENAQRHRQLSCHGMANHKRT